MGTEGRVRSSQRALQAEPEDAPAWLRLAWELERAGRHDEAGVAALKAFRLEPESPQVLERLAALGLGDGLWPCARGDVGQRQRSLLPGPERGVQRFAILAREPFGRPLVDLRGGVLVRGRPTGLSWIDPFHARDQLIAADWPGLVAPCLLRGRPRAFDRNLLRPWGPDSDSLQHPRLTSFLPGPALHYVPGSDGLLAVDPEGEVRWKLPLPGVPELAVPPHGPLLVLALGGKPGVRQVLGLSRDGVPLWWREFPFGAEERATVAVGEGGTFLVQLGDQLLCLGYDGHPRWSRTVSGLVPPAGFGELVYAVSPREGLLGLDAQSGEPRWRRQDLRSTQPPAIDGQGAAFLATLDGQLASVGLDGESRLTVELEAREGPLGPVSLGDRTAYLTAGRVLIAVR